MGIDRPSTGLTWEKGTPEHYTGVSKESEQMIAGEQTMPSVLAIRDSVKAQLNLLLDDILYTLILDLSQLLLRNRAIVRFRTGLEQLIRTKEGPKVFRPERRVSMQSQSHLWSVSKNGVARGRKAGLEGWPLIHLAAQTYM